MQFKFNEFEIQEYPYANMCKLVTKSGRSFYIDWDCKFYLKDDFTHFFDHRVAHNKNLKVLKSHRTGNYNYGSIVLDEVMCY